LYILVQKTEPTPSIIVSKLFYSVLMNFDNKLGFQNKKKIVEFNDQGKKLKIKFCKIDDVSKFNMLGNEIF